MVSISDVKQKDRVIEELMRFTRKVLMEPEICSTAKEIARKHMGQENAVQLIADELNATTSVHIGLERSEADELFIELLIEVVKDEQALY
jgi:hypothetical protein